MFDVLVYLYENYWRPDACPEPQQLRRKLSAVGFEADEIQDALRWLDGLAVNAQANVEAGASQAAAAAPDAGDEAAEDPRAALAQGAAATSGALKTSTSPTPAASATGPSATSADTGADDTALDAATSAALPPVVSTSLRVYTDAEQDVLCVECRGFISFLETAGVLPPPMREMVIDRAMAVGSGSLDLDDLKIIVLMVFWSLGEEPDALVLDELFVDSEDRVIH